MAASGQTLPSDGPSTNGRSRVVSGSRWRSDALPLSAESGHSQAPRANHGVQSYGYSVGKCFSARGWCGGAIRAWAITPLSRIVGSRCELRDYAEMSSAPQSTAASRSQHIWLKHPSRGIRLLVKSGRWSGSSPGRDVPILEGDAGPVPSPTEADRSAPAQAEDGRYSRDGEAGRRSVPFQARRDEFYERWSAIPSCDSRARNQVLSRPASSCAPARCRYEQNQS